VQKLETPVVLRGLDDDLVMDLDHHGRGILADTVKLHLHAVELKVNHGSNAFDALDHAGGNGGKEEFGRVEGVGPSVNIRVEHECCLLRGGFAAVSVEPSCGDAIFKHGD